jgi:hypothetical protein
VKPRVSDTTVKAILFYAVVLALLCAGVQADSAFAQTTFDCSAVTEIPQAEYEALVALYNSTDGAM